MNIGYRLRRVPFRAPHSQNFGPQRTAVRRARASWRGQYRTHGLRGCRPSDSLMVRVALQHPATASAAVEIPDALQAATLPACAPCQKLRCPPIATARRCAGDAMKNAIHESPHATETAISRSVIANGALIVLTARDSHTHQTIAIHFGFS